MHLLPFALWRRSPVEVREVFKLSCGQTITWHSDRIRRVQVLVRHRTFPRSDMLETNSGLFRLSPHVRACALGCLSEAWGKPLTCGRGSCMKSTGTPNDERTNQPCRTSPREESKSAPRHQELLRLDFDPAYTKNRRVRC